MHHRLQLWTLSALSALCLVAAGPAQAQTTINFDSLTAGALASGGLEIVGPTYSSQGFTLTPKTATIGGKNQFDALAGSDPTYGDGETSLYTDGSTTLTKDGGGTFTFSGIDLGLVPIFAGRKATAQVIFTGTKADSTIVTVTDTLSITSGYQTFTNFAGFTNLTSLVFAPTAAGSNNPPEFDNIKLDQPAPVPEASTTASFGLLLALGMGGLVIAVKRKKAVA